MPSPATPASPRPHRSLPLRCRPHRYTLAASPTLTLDLKGSTQAQVEQHKEEQQEAETGQLCLSSSFDVEVVAATELDININLLDFHKDWTWGPTTVASWKGRPLPKKCVGNASAD